MQRGLCYALGRRLSKTFDGTITRWVYDRNTPLHEWSYNVQDKPQAIIDDTGQLHWDKSEPTENIITWVFEEGSFKPAAKLVNNKRYSIICDYLGTPVEMYDELGTKVWECELDIYGRVKNIKGNNEDCPFRYQGQYEDVETGLYYNRFRYYSAEEGLYISQDPIKLASQQLSFYAYVNDNNIKIDPWGLYDLFRSVSIDERFDIKNNGWQGGNNMQSKWFAESKEHAIEWGKQLGHGEDKFYVLKVTVPDNIVANAYTVPHLDGIGPAKNLECDDLNKYAKITEVTKIKCK